MRGPPRPRGNSTDHVKGTARFESPGRVVESSGRISRGRRCTAALGIVGACTTQTNNERIDYENAFKRSCYWIGERFQPGRVSRLGGSGSFRSRANPRQRGLRGATGAPRRVDRGRLLRALRAAGRSGRGVAAEFVRADGVGGTAGGVWPQLK